MKLPAIGNLTPGHQAPDAEAKQVADARKVAQQFEAIFLRQLMGTLEKSGGFGGSGTGSGIYKSMMVGALAESTAEGGGIGLADVVFKAMMPQAVAAAAPAQPHESVSASATSAALPATKPGGR
ncbi:MAG TPA: rod-binding protein [Polyangiaceae bacterium]|jgi:flagellar protein FlgJ|nr:rod-binding protein [Polyangiaceae bacterium]